MAKRKKSNSNNKQHDEFVKKQLSNKTMAQDLIRQFLPKNLVEKLNLSLLEIDTNSYITHQLEKYFSDLVWLCPYKDSLIRIAFLIEHKSYPVAYPHLQLLRYMLEIWEKNLNASELLIPIVPIVFYHGEDKWNNRPLTEYFEGVDADFLQYIPQFNYELIDIGQYSDKDIIAFKIGLLKNVLLALRYINDKNYLRHNFGVLFIETEESSQTPLGIDFMLSMFAYLLKNSEFSSQNLEDMINQIPSPIKEFTMTSYDYLIKKGKDEGIEKEKLEVIRKARLKGSSIEFIAEIVSLEESRVRKILDEMGID